MDKYGFKAYEKRMIILCDSRYDDYRKKVQELVSCISLATEPKVKDGFRMELKRVLDAIRLDMFGQFYTDEYQKKGVFDYEEEWKRMCESSKNLCDRSKKR